MSVSKVVNISGEYSAIFTTYVDGQLYVGEYGVRYNYRYELRVTVHHCKHLIVVTLSDCISYLVTVVDSYS